MNTYIKDPGGWKTNSDPGGVGGSPLSLDSGSGEGYIKDPGTGI
ncbi:hypothetical protein [Bacillus sp. BR_7a]